MDADAAAGDKDNNVCNEHHDYDDDDDDDDDDDHDDDGGGGDDDDDGDDDDNNYYDSSSESMLLSSLLFFAWHCWCLWRVSFRGSCAGLAPGGHAARLDVFHGSILFKDPNPDCWSMHVHVCPCFINSYFKFVHFWPPKVEPYASICICLMSLVEVSRQCANLQMAIWGRLRERRWFRCRDVPRNWCLLMFTYVYQCSYIGKSLDIIVLETISDVIILQLASFVWVAVSNPSILQNHDGCRNLRVEIVYDGSQWHGRVGKQRLFRLLSLKT